jgi:hypothetical protein
METGPAVALIQRVRDRQLDAVVVGLPAATAGLMVTSVGRQGAVVAMGSADRLTDAGTVSLKQLDPARLAVMPRAVNPAFHDSVLSLCRAAGVAPALFEVPEPRVESVLLAVAAGAGPAVLPAAAAERYAIPGVRFVALEDGESAFESAVLTHPEASDLGTAAFVSAVSRFAAMPVRAPARPVRPALRLAA